MLIDLKGLKVLVTRPAGQAENLCELIEAHNGTAIIFPTLEIEAADDNDKIVQRLLNLSKYQIAIFVSRNAVLKTLEHPECDKKSLKELTLFAAGSGTANQLAQGGIEDVIHAQGQASSEELLAMSQLQAAAVRNKDILIFRGQGGRKLLAETLRGRGAKVNYVEVYKRVCPKYEASRIEKLWAKGGPDIIVVTSCEALKNLFDILNVEQKEMLLDKQLVTISKRVAEMAAKFEFSYQALLADEVSDRGILDVINRFVLEARDD